MPGRTPRSPWDGWRGCSPMDPGAEWETHMWRPDFVAFSGLSLEPTQGPSRLAACGPFPPCRPLAGSCVRLHRSLSSAGWAGLGPRSPWEPQGVPSSHLGAWEAPAGLASVWGHGTRIRKAGLPPAWGAKQCWGLTWAACSGPTSGVRGLLQAPVSSMAMITRDS